ncbi:hypothetical protein U9M48_043980 [Paspalum notatum var. saurae]|uniref:F-box domain-containing protein n=1 Tax=Paspalum notatum var. saurae TaxID=547442 RepID=A0AAQ3UUJ5_PASNO
MDRGGSQKRRHKSVANVDIISNLPDVIKDKILCCLPIKEAVRTCFLSRKWRYTWASMTELIFREDDFSLGNGNEDGETENNIGELVASCPNLEKLVLSRLFSFADISIHSTKLKVLRVDGMFKHLNLVTPHVSSAVIDLQVNTGYVPRAGCNFNLSEFIGSLLDIENISLLGHAFELMCRGYSVPSSTFWDSIDHQAGLFKNLDMVVMSNFTGSCAESSFLKLLLEDGPMLRTARIEDNNKLDKESLKQLLKMRRASKDAEVILL